MCTVCGCGDSVTKDGVPIGEHHPHDHDHDHDHGHGHGHGHGHHHHDHHHHSHDHGHHDHHHHDHHDHDHHHYGTGPAGVSVPGLSQERLIAVETAILSKNDSHAAGNRRVLKALGVYAVNLVSSPGSGKTALLC
ncbi:MAG: hydrogenase accessory protein HypB, partial [Paracoccus sp. (in: a-proteobacteria)]